MIKMWKSPVKRFSWFLKSRGYFNPVVNFSLRTNKLNTMVYFKVMKGEAARLNRVYIRGDDKGLSTEKAIFLIWKVTLLFFLLKR